MAILRVLASKKLAAVRASLSVILLSLSIPVVADPPPPQLPPMMRATVADLRASLQLNASQQEQLQRAVTKTQEVLAQVRANRAQLLESFHAEMQKDVPDLAALGQAKDRLESESLALRQSARTEWLSLYAQLTPEQILVLKQKLNTIVGKLEAMQTLFAS